ncbi:MAG: RecQ family ATP-dependent DNA helicase [Bacteroidota bacterium]
MQSKIHQLLLQYWGHRQFRPLQEDIIASIFSGKDTLALLPTGGGKSICFQVPALAMEGICIVVSPLIALMKDQVQNLNNRGINAVCVVSGMARKEIDITLDNCVYGKVKFLYVSPERLATDMFRERVKKMKVNIIAVDEAHCISQWGYDFRPHYLRISELRELLPAVPVIALTATATPEVVKDIQEKLKFKTENVFRKSFERKNIAYVVQYEENKNERLLKIATKLKGSGIVYVRNRKKTQQTAEFLQKNSFSAGFYHAGLDHLQRDKIQKDWVDGKIKVICATNAFGMGIDKPDVRFVVHLDLPESPEAYFQEAGRAGRDERKAYAVVLYNAEDLSALEEQHTLSFPDAETVKRTYLALGNYYQLAVGSGQDESYDFNMTEFCQRFNLQPAVTFHCMRLMETAGFIMLSESFHSPSRVKIEMPAADLYNFQIANPSWDGFIKLLLRSYSGMFEALMKINESDLAKRVQVNAEVIKKYLVKLSELNVITYIPQSDQPKLTFLMPRISDRDFYLSPEVYNDRKKAAAKRVGAMKHYVSETHRCRSLMLLEYFGEKNEYRCGICDYCIKQNKLELSNIQVEVISQEIQKITEARATDLKDLIFQLLHHDEEKVKKVIRWLLDNDELVFTGDNKLKWNG